LDGTRIEAVHRPMEAHSARFTKESAVLDRRHFIVGTVAACASGLLPEPARANVSVGYDWNAVPPTDPKPDFINWMIKNPRRGPDVFRPALGSVQAVGCQPRHLAHRRPVTPHPF
jgi:hypothetical protein